MKIDLITASQLLKSGNVVGVPTETVYGLAASFDQPEAIQKIFQLKARPANNPLIIHLANANEIQTYTKEIPPQFNDLSKAFWPGPLTLILPVDTTLISDVIRAKLPTAGFRIPKHPLTLELLNITGPLVMPSANLSGRPSATKSEHVEDDFGADFPVLDGGECVQGVESTILHFSGKEWEIIRLGAISQEMFQPILGYLPKIVGPQSNKDPICPGQLYRHYAPKAKLTLCKSALQCKESSEVIVGFSDRGYPNAIKKYLLGPSDTPEIVASNLYAILRQLDQEGIVAALVDFDFPSKGLWITIRERLEKASKR